MACLAVSEAGRCLPVRSAIRKTARVQFSREGESLDYCVFAGPTPKGRDQPPHPLTGRSPLPPPPAWTAPPPSPRSTTSDGHAFHRRDGPPRHAAGGLPLRLLLDARGSSGVILRWNPRASLGPRPCSNAGAKGSQFRFLDQSYIAQKSPALPGRQPGPHCSSATAKPGKPTSGSPAWASSTSPTRRRRPGPGATCTPTDGHGRRCFKTDFGERIPGRGRGLSRQLRPRRRDAQPPPSSLAGPSSGDAGSAR